jgi:glycosyltransferase involved in cell wall biosynthesis
VSTPTSPITILGETKPQDPHSSAVSQGDAVPERQPPIPVPRAPSPSESAPTARSIVSLIIPTKNEAANIRWVLENVPDRVDEVILVDGRSTDATVVTARSCRPDVRVLIQEGAGKGDALLTGFLAARGDIIVMIDADGSMAPSEIPDYVYFLEHGYDFVKGSRFIGGGGSRDISPTRRAGNAALVRLVNSFYHAHLTDLCYGFCAFHRRYLDYLGVTTPGFEVEAMMIVSAIKSGLRIAEVPSLEMPRRFGRSNLRTFRDGTRVLRTILRENDSGISGQAVQHVRSMVHRPPVPAGARTPAPSP